MVVYGQNQSEGLKCLTCAVDQSRLVADAAHGYKGYRLRDENDWKNRVGVYECFELIFQGSPEIAKSYVDQTSVTTNYKLPDAIRITIQPGNGVVNDHEAKLWVNCSGAEYTR